MSEAAERVSTWQIRKPEVKTDEIARIERSLDLIDDALVMKAVRIVLRRYGIRKKLKPPVCSVSTEALKARGGTHYICGSATRDEFKIYEPGVRQREERGANYLLTLLHVYLHEYVHMLEGEHRSKHKRITIGGVRLHGVKVVSGYRVRVELKLPKEFGFDEGLLVLNDTLNEAVTETLAREAVAEYLQLDPRYGGVSDVAVDIHRNLMESDSDLVFYPTAVRFLSMLCQELQQAFDSERDMRSFLYKGYFKGTDVLRSSRWMEILERCELVGIMQSCSGQNPNTAEKLIAMIHSKLRNLGTQMLEVAR